MVGSSKYARKTQTNKNRIVIEELEINEIRRENGYGDRRHDRILYTANSAIMWSLVPGRYNGNFIKYSITYVPIPAFLLKRHVQGRTAQFKQRYGTTQTCFAAPKND